MWRRLIERSGCQELGCRTACLGRGPYASHAELDDILDPGEAEAIILAVMLKADSLLLDEMEARKEALRRGLPVAGTIGLLEMAAEHNLIDLSLAFSRLANTSFHISPEVLRQALRRHAANRKK